VRISEADVSFFKERIRRHNQKLRQEEPRECAAALLRSSRAFAPFSRPENGLENSECVTKKSGIISR